MSIIAFRDGCAGARPDSQQRPVNVSLEAEAAPIRKDICGRGNWCEKDKKVYLSWQSRVCRNIVSDRRLSMTVCNLALYFPEAAPRGGKVSSVVRNAKHLRLGIMAKL